MRGLEEGLKDFPSRALDPHRTIIQLAATHNACTQTYIIKEFIHLYVVHKPRDNSRHWSQDAAYHDPAAECI